MLVTFNVYFCKENNDESARYDTVSNGRGEISEKLTKTEIYNRYSLIMSTDFLVDTVQNNIHLMFSLCERANG